MGNRSTVKVGTTLAVITRTVRLDGGAFDFSDPKYRVLVSGEDPSGASGPTLLYFERDVTSIQATAGNPPQGVAAVPLYSGRGLLGASTGPVAVGAGQIVTVTQAASATSGVVRQAIYMSQVGTSSPLYLVAEGPDGFASGGFPIGDPTYVAGSGEIVPGLAAGTPAADSILVQLAPTVDESATNGELTVAPGPAVGSAVAGGAGGTIDAGNHDFAVLEIRDPDANAPREIEFEIIFEDTTSGDRITWPTDGREIIGVTDRIG